MNKNVNDAEVDFNYSLDLLERINNSKSDGVLLRDYLANEIHSPWTSQQFFLFNHIKDFSKNRSFSRYSQERIPNISLMKKILLFLFNCFVLCVSGIACMSARIKHTSISTFSSDLLAPDIPVNHRLYNVYVYLKQNNISYLEIVHITTVKNLFINMWRRRQIVFYYETIPFLAKIFSFSKGAGKNHNMHESINLDSFSEYEYDFVKYIVSRALENIEIDRVKKKILQVIMKVGGIKTFVSIDDPRFIDEIVLACQQVDIKTHIFQHSNFDYRIGLDSLSPEQYIFPDFFYLWNEYWLERIPEISPVFKTNMRRCHIGGRAYKFAQNIYQHTAPPMDNHLNILIPSEIALSSNQVRPYVGTLMKDERIHIFFTPRNDFPRESQIKKYFRDVSQSHRVTFFEKTEFSKIIPKIHLVAGVYSGYLDEMIEICVPVAILNTDYPCINRLDYAGMAVSVDLEKGDLYEQLKNIACTPLSILDERRKNLSRGTPDVSDTIGMILSKLPNETIHQ